MTKVIAHRGASGYCPENTMIAFEKAIMMGSDGIELDIHLTKDRKIAVMHDFTLERTTSAKGEIKNFTYRELRAADAGSWYSPEFSRERIPLLKDVLSLCAGENILINIEVKAGSFYYSHMEEILLEELSKYTFKGEVIISSFDHFALQSIGTLDKSAKTGLLYSSSMIDVSTYAKSIVGAVALHPHFFWVTPDLIKEASDQGLSVNAYTVNDADTAKRLLCYGVSGLMTNYPDLLLGLI